MLFFLTACTNSNKEKNAASTSGFTYKIIPAANGAQLQKGDVVKVMLRQAIDDSLMSSSYDGMPVYVKLDSSVRQYDFTEILPQMKVNDSAICFFPTKEIIKRADKRMEIPAFLRKGKVIQVQVKVINRFADETLGHNDFVKESERFNEKMKAKEAVGFASAAHRFDNLIQTIRTPLQKLPNGVVIEVLQKGNGAKINAGDSVAITYKGMLENKEVFETTTQEMPFVFVVGEGRAVEGFDTGIMALAFGDKARLYIPSQMAYGAKGAGEKIKPFSNLIFEVEVNSTKK